MLLTCGLGSKIGALEYVGLSKNRTSSCSSLLKKPKTYQSQFDDECYYKNKQNNKLFDYTTLSIAKDSY